MYISANKPAADIQTAGSEVASIACSHAAIYHGYLSQLQAMATAQERLVKQYRSEYDFFYDHLNKLSPDVREAREPQICATVKTIEEGAAALAGARDGVAQAFNAASISKVREIARGIANSGKSLGEQYLIAMGEFREWRVAHLDGGNVDLAPLLDSRKDFSQRHAGMFEVVFKEWAKITQPRLSVENARLSVLDHLALVQPELAKTYIEGMRLPGGKIFGKKLAPVSAEDLDISL